MIMAYTSKLLEEFYQIPVSKIGILFEKLKITHAHN